MPPSQTETHPRILVVHEDESIRENLDHLLSADYRVASARDAEEALRILESERIDLLVTDLQTPGPDGDLLIQAVRRQYMDLPAVLMTVQPFLDEPLEESSLRGAILLQKPFEAEEIQRLVAAELHQPA
jgi:two-component system response regulator FlrC